MLGQKVTHILCIKVLVVAAVHVLQQRIHHHMMIPVVVDASHLHDEFYELRVQLVYGCSFFASSSVYSLFD